MEVGAVRETDVDHTDDAERAEIHDVEAARTLLDRAACIADNVRNATGEKPDTARLMVEIAREYREIAMAQSYLTTDPLRWVGEVSSEQRAEPEPLPLVPEAASISMVRELEEINKLLREAGFEYPVGARGVKDVLHMRREDLAELDAINETLRSTGITGLSGADGVSDLVRVCHALGGGCPPNAPGSATVSDLRASQGPEIPVGGLDDLRPAETDAADSSPGADEICADLTYRDQTDTLWRMIAHHNGQPIMCDWYPRIARWGPMVRTWRELVETYGPITKGELW